MYYQNFLLQASNCLDPLFYSGFLLLTSKAYYQFAQNITLFFAIKFLFSVGFLILIRGGTPRYRYDYLTKLGWLKFLTLVIVVFFATLLNFFVW